MNTTRAAVVLAGLALAAAPVRAEPGKPRIVLPPARRAPVDFVSTEAKTTQVVPTKYEKVKVWRGALGTSPKLGAYRIAVLAEGYTAADEGLFRADARRIMTHLATSREARTMGLFRNFELFFVFTPSKQAASVLKLSETRFGAFLAPKGIVTLTSSGQEVLKELATSVVKKRVHATVSLVHFGDEGAPRSADERPRANADFPEKGAVVRLSASEIEYALVHELGHALFGLGDEYGTDHADDELPAGTFAAQFARCFNLSNELVSSRWRYLTAGPTFSGGATYGKGVFHPFKKCHMNETADPFCDACYAAMRDQVRTENGAGAPVYGLNLALLSPSASLGPGKGDGVLLRATGETLKGLPLLHVSANTPFAITWTALEGRLPRTVKVWVEGSGVRYDGTVESAGNVCPASQAVFLGLPAVKGKPTTFAVRVSVDDQSIAAIPAVIQIDP